MWIEKLYIVIKNKQSLCSECHTWKRPGTSVRGTSSRPPVNFISTVGKLWQAQNIFVIQTKGRFWHSIFATKRPKCRVCGNVTFLHDPQLHFADKSFPSWRTHIVWNILMFALLQVFIWYLRNFHKNNYVRTFGRS